MEKKTKRRMGFYIQVGGKWICRRGRGWGEKGEKGKYEEKDEKKEIGGEKSGDLGKKGEEE